jgi:hypothetical protein
MFSQLNVDSKTIKLIKELIQNSESENLFDSLFLRELDELIVKSTTIDTLNDNIVRSMLVAEGKYGGMSDFTIERVQENEKEIIYKINYGNSSTRIFVEVSNLKLFKDLALKSIHQYIDDNDLPF